MQTPTPFSVVLLAGGTGTRMGSCVPKQYLMLHQKPLALYSFEALASSEEIQDFVVVCEQQYESLFLHCAKLKGIDIQFARPGIRRQDSVYNGLQLLQGNPLVCIHDSARPLIQSTIIRQVVQAAQKDGAAVVGVKARSTIKICDEAQIVIDTPNRAYVWEIQTPQVIRLELLKEGFEYAYNNQITVTDDVSLVELLGKAIKVIEGCYSNIKVTTPDDLIFIEKLMEKYVLL